MGPYTPEAVAHAIKRALTSAERRGELEIAGDVVGIVNVDEIKDEPGTLGVEIVSGGFTDLYFVRVEEA